MADITYSASPALGESLLLSLIPEFKILCNGGASAPARHDCTHFNEPGSNNESTKAKNSPENKTSIGIHPISGLNSLGSIEEPSGAVKPLDDQRIASISDEKTDKRCSPRSNEAAGIKS